VAHAWRRRSSRSGDGDAPLTRLLRGWAEPQPARRDRSARTAHACCSAFSPRLAPRASPPGPTSRHVGLRAPRDAPRSLRAAARTDDARGVQEDAGLTAGHASARRASRSRWWVTAQRRAHLRSCGTKRASRGEGSSSISAVTRDAPSTPRRGNGKRSTARRRRPRAAPVPERGYCIAEEPGAASSPGFGTHGPPAQALCFRREFVPRTNTSRRSALQNTGDGLPRNGSPLGE
jgi:hypothetical protein